MKRTVNPEKLRVALRKLTRRDLLVVVDRALVHVPKHRLAGVVDGLISLDDLVARTGKRRVLVIEKVKAFDDASRRGDYYESFNVNSKNFMKMSAGTEEWIGEFKRLLGEALVFAADGDAYEARQAFETLIALLRRIDEGEDDVVFFADEGGSWQVGVDWSKVLPAYFRCLSVSATPAEYAKIVCGIVRGLARHDAPKHLSRARGAATKDQKAALTRVVGLKVARR